MKTIREASEHLTEIGVAPSEIEQIEKAAQDVLDAENRDVDGIAAGVRWYPGHAADEASDGKECEPFYYAWLRFDFAGDHHQMIKVKLADISALKFDQVH